GGFWRGTCQLRMWGETTAQSPIPDARFDPNHKPGAGGPGEVILYLEFRIIRPSEEALAKGKWLLPRALTQSQVAQAPAYLMREVTSERGIETGDFHDNWLTHGKTTTTGGVYLCDYDRDGILDILITDINRHALYKGLPGGKFRDVTAEVGLPLALPDLPGMAGIAGVVALGVERWEGIATDVTVYRNT